MTVRKTRVTTNAFFKKNLNKHLYKKLYIYDGNYLSVIQHSCTLVLYVKCMGIVGAKK